MTEFSLLDHVIFFSLVLLTVATGIGVWCMDYKTSIPSNSLCGVLSIYLSMIATDISPILLLTFTIEVYVYGSESIYCCFGLILAVFLFVTTILPVTFDLQLDSIFGYLELRFNNKIKLFCSGISCVLTLFCYPVNLYCAAIALSVMTSGEIKTIAILLIIGCTLYTLIGGFRTVVYSNLAQCILVFAVTILIALVSTFAVGGFSNIWDINMAVERINLPNFTFDMTERYTFFSTLLGDGFLFLGLLTIHPQLNNRIIALPSLSLAKLSVIIYAIAIAMFICLLNYIGLALYAYFDGCDPVLSSQVTKWDRLLPFAITKLNKGLPGLRGLFVAGIFCAGLSTFSSFLDSYSLLIVSDFCLTFLKKEITKKDKYFYKRIVVSLLGITSIGVIFLVDNFENTFQFIKNAFSILVITIFSMYFMGMLLPWVNTLGAICGSLSGAAFIIWVFTGYIIATTNGMIPIIIKDLSVDMCEMNFTFPATDNDTVQENPTEMPFIELYSMSYNWYTVIGLIISVAVGLIVSFVSGPNDANNVDMKLLAPFLRKENEVCRSNKHLVIHSSEMYY